MNVETPAGPGLENLAGGRVHSQDTTGRRSAYPATPVDVIERRRPAHELRAELWDLWREGFRAGQEAAQSRIDQANANADRFYAVAYNSEEARARHAALLKDFDVALARRATAAQWDELDRIAGERAEAARG
ncbi:hypothetical protein [Microbacterium sp.]|uniref:hypothetical protein n=1 Tax=Microbacterium sp. TaxID=51671 RepID=UPI003736A1F3